MDKDHRVGLKRLKDQDVHEELEGGEVDLKEGTAQGQKEEE